MAVKSNKPKIERKADYSNKLRRLIDEYSKILIVQADNVGSNQLQQIRHGLRGESVVLMGKNTLMKRSVKVHMEETGNRDIEPLLDLLKGNVGLLFTSGDLKEVREVISKFKVGAPARVGVVAPSDVTIPTGSTGLDPSQTAFFQALNIPTKINKGVVEILSPVEIIQKGEKVNSSQAMLLSKLGIKPFSYGLVVHKVYEDGTVYDPEILDLTEDDLAAKFAVGLSRVAAVALAISYPTIVAAPHMLINGYKNVLAVALATDYSFPLADKVKEFLEDPGKFLVAAAPAVADAGGAASAPKEEEKKEEPESSEEEGMLGLFDD